MCQFKSALCLKDWVFVPDYDSHDQMLKELGIPDDYLHASKTFVRVELSPADGDPASDPMGWRIRIDQDILPYWFVHEVDEQRVKVAIAEWCKAHVFRDGHHVVHDGVWIATGSSTVVARGSSTVDARGSSTVDARDSSTVVAWDSSKVDAWDSSTVDARGSSTVDARDSSTVVAWDSSTVGAWGSSTVDARGSSTVDAWDSSTVVAWDSSTVVAWDSSTVVLPKEWQTKQPVKLHDEAICINHKTHTIRSVIKWQQEENA